MSVRLIENNSDISERVLKELKLEDNYPEIKYMISKEANSIWCIDKMYNIILSLNLDNPRKSSVSCDPVLKDDYSNPNDFFSTVSYLDDLSTKFRHILMDFSSIFDNIKEEY